MLQYLFGELSEKILQRGFLSSVVFFLLCMAAGCLSGKITAKRKPGQNESGSESRVEDRDRMLHFS